MTPSLPAHWPHRLDAATVARDRSIDAEVAALQALRDAGVPVAPMAVMPAEAEERFYRFNNLPERLEQIFEGVDPVDPDEDDLEALAPRAVLLLERHFLLDELIDAFYDRIADLPDRLHVRRPASTGLHAARGRPALLAVKRLWAADWSFDALAQRVPMAKTFALEARDVLVHGVEAPASADVLERVAAVLGSEVRAWVGPGGGVARIADGSRPPTASA